MMVMWWYDAILGPLDLFDFISSVIGPFLVNYSPNTSFRDRFRTFELRVYINGRGPREIEAIEESKRTGKPVNWPPTIAAPTPIEVRTHLKKHGVRVWCSGFNRTQIKYRILVSQREWAEWLVEQDNEGYCWLRHPRRAWGEDLRTPLERFLERTVSKQRALDPRLNQAHAERKARQTKRPARRKKKPVSRGVRMVAKNIARGRFPWER